MTWDAVLIDLYDTLVWSEWSAFRDLLCRRLAVEPVDLMRALDRTRPARSIGTYPDAEGDMAAILDELGIEDRGVGRELADMERAFFSEDRIHVHPDSLPAIRSIREVGARTALVSNCSHSTRPIVNRMGLEHEFDAVILSFEVGAEKPRPEIYRAALDALGGAAPSTALFVDDQPRYCDGARALGIDTRLMVRGADPPEGSVRDTNGHTVIRDLRALLG
jgi:putative hydrolase of the HAD superfamily